MSDKLTLLDTWTAYGGSAWAADNPQFYDEIRRALAVAQAVEWYDTYDPQAVESIMRRAAVLADRERRG